MSNIVKFNLVPKLQKVIVTYADSGTSEIAYTDLEGYLEKYAQQESDTVNNLSVNKEMYSYKGTTYLSAHLFFT